MRIGVFCTYENHERDFARCFDMQTRYVQHAEALGIDEAWVAEHHFDPDAVSPSILMLLAYLAGVTSRIRLGSAAVLIAFRIPFKSRKMSRRSTFSPRGGSILASPRAVPSRFKTSIFTRERITPGT